MSGSCCSELISIPTAAASVGSGSSRPCLIKMLTKIYVDEHNTQWVMQDHLFHNSYLCKCILHPQQCKKWDEWKERKKNVKIGLLNKNYIL